MKVENYIKTYRKSDSISVTLTDGDPPEICIKSSDWSKNMVVLVVGKMEVMVKAKDLQAAIDNATNLPQ